MRRAISLVLLLLLLLTGCRTVTPPTNEELGWDEDWLRIAEMGVEPVDGFTLFENKDTMDFTGLYYATWSAGESETITNEDDEEAQVFDAQIYMAVQRYKSETEAKNTVDGWLRQEAENYTVGEQATKTFAGQSFDILPLLQGKESNPYSHGAAAFAAWKDWGICVELICRDSYTGDPEAILEDFLDGIHYADYETEE